MKKYLLILLTFSLLITGCGQKEEEKKTEKVSKESTVTPLLVEVTKNESSNKLYLFGSIHAADKSLYPFPDYVLNAYNDSDALAVEFDLIDFNNDFSGQMEYASSMVYSDGTTIADNISKELYEESKTLLEENNSYTSLYDYYKPVMWLSLVENLMMEESGLSGNDGVDNYFLNMAKKDKKEIIELESAKFQMDLLTGFEDELQELLLASAVMEYDDGVESLKSLYDLYKKGDKEKLEKFLSADSDVDETYSENAKALAQKYNDAMITSRNKSMTKNLEKYFSEDKNVFCVVGLAHIISEGGIADLLKQNGYTINIIN